MSDAELLVPLTLVVGPEELLVAREVRRIVAAARARDADADVRELAGDAVELGLLLDLATPSMFGGDRVVVIRDAQDLAEDVREALVGYIDQTAAEPAPDVVLVIAHSGVVKGKRLLDAMKAAKARVVTIAPIGKPGERLEFVQGEIRAAGRESTAGAVRALVEAVGTDLRELAAAVAQLVADTPPGTAIDERTVAAHHRGRAETSGFAIADAAVAGDVAGALALLRHALDDGESEVYMLSALATGLRDIGLVRGASGPSGALAKRFGMPPWKVEKAQRVARGWTDDGVAAAVGAVAEADRMLKGEGASNRHTIEQAVLAIAHARSTARAVR
ncbi:MAG TPA: DNA polymerase III subunit delta [Mycobacteriales bacterium]|nr:DNA polymerase III subunit delta [Mycobacteriales bacterium]